MNLHKNAFTTVLVAILASLVPHQQWLALLDMTEAPSILLQKPLCKKNSLTLLPRITQTSNSANLKIDAPQSTIDEYHGDANLYAESIAKAYEEDTASNTRETKNASTRGTATYTSSVFSESQQEELVGQSKIFELQ